MKNEKEFSYVIYKKKLEELGEINNEVEVKLTNERV